MIRFWQVATGKLKLTLPKRNANGFSIAYSPDGNTIINAGLGIHNCMTNFIAISTDGMFVVDGGEMGGIRL